MISSFCFFTVVCQKYVTMSFQRAGHQILPHLPSFQLLYLQVAKMGMIWGFPPGPFAAWERMNWFTTCPNLWCLREIGQSPFTHSFFVNVTKISRIIISLTSKKKMVSLAASNLVGVHVHPWAFSVHAVHAAYDGLWERTLQNRGGSPNPTHYNMSIMDKQEKMEDVLL